MNKRHLSVRQQTWALLCKNVLKKWRMKRETLMVWFRVYAFSFLAKEKVLSLAVQTLYLHYLMFYIYSISNYKLDYFLKIVDFAIISKKIPLKYVIIICLSGGILNRVPIQKFPGK